MLLFPTISMPPQLLACRKKSRMKSPLNNRVTMTLPAGTRGQCQVYMQGLGYTRKNLQVYQVWCHCSYDVAASFRTCCRITTEKWHFNTQIIALLCLLELEKYLLLRGVFVDSIINSGTTNKATTTPSLNAFPSFARPALWSMHTSRVKEVQVQFLPQWTSAHISVFPVGPDGISASERLEWSTSRLSIYDFFCISYWAVSE